MAPKGATKTHPAADSQISIQAALKVVFEPHGVE